VPVTLHYLNNDVYGIWMAMTSILYWFSFFDVGLGNGMRNYLTQAISANDFGTAKSIISTSLFILLLIACVIGLLAVVPLSLFDFGKLFKTTAIAEGQLRSVMFVAVAFTLALLVVKNIGFIFVAFQKYAFNDLLTVSGSVAALLIIYVLTKTTEGNLMYVVMAFTITPVVVFLMAAIPVFLKYPQLRPSWKSIDAGYARKVVSKGIGFFFIQITSCLVIYGSSNIFITYFRNSSAVTTYNIAYKYFNLLAIAFTVILSPIWNAYTDAYVKSDMAWIAKTFGRTCKTWLLSVAGGVVMLAASGLFYHLWVGDSVQVPFSVSVCVLLYICFYNFNNCVTYLLNGLNKIRVQIYTSCIMTVVFVLMVMPAGRRFGIEGVAVCMAISYALMGAVHLYQCRLLLQQKARGVWNK
jgi:O-antigen/teichoic acid export membrane protein